MSNYIKKHNMYLLVVRTVLVAALTNYNELETKDKDTLSEFNDFFIKLSKYYGNKRRIKETIYDGLLESSNILNKIKKYKTDIGMLIDKNDYIIYKINKKKEYYISEIMEYINKIKEYFAKYQMTGGTKPDKQKDGRDSLEIILNENVLLTQIKKSLKNIPIRQKLEYINRLIEVIIRVINNIKNTEYRDIDYDNFNYNLYTIYSNILQVLSTYKQTL